MTIVFESSTFQADPQVTATHVLLIGCGEYPGLQSTAPHASGLTSPSLSSAAMADWFLSGKDALGEHAFQPQEAFHNPYAPLGSLALLMSPAAPYSAPSGHQIMPSRPTLANIRAAYFAWLTRLGTNPSSRGVFYFCGHGVGDGASQSLLADDVDPSSHLPLSHSMFHLSNTCQASIRQTAAALYFFIDACADFSREIRNAIGTTDSLIAGDVSSMPLTQDWDVLGAATTNQKAYAPQHDIARFTSALLAALRGHCGSQSSAFEGYGVGMSDLRKATAAFLRHNQSTQSGPRQKVGQISGDGDGTAVLHVLHERPSVLVELDIEPAGYRPVAEAFTTSGSGPKQTKALAHGPVSFRGAQGEWSYGTQATGNEYAQQTFDGLLLTDAVHARCFRVG